MAVDTLLPESGIGFVTNNRCDNGACQFGQKSTIDAALAVGVAWDPTWLRCRPFSVWKLTAASVQ